MAFLTKTWRDAAAPLIRYKWYIDICKQTFLVHQFSPKLFSLSLSSRTTISADLQEKRRKILMGNGHISWKSFNDAIFHRIKDQNLSIKWKFCAAVYIWQPTSLTSIFSQRPIKYPIQCQLLKKRHELSIHYSRLDHFINCLSPKSFFLQQLPGQIWKPDFRKIFRNVSWQVTTTEKFHQKMVWKYFPV